MLCILFIIVFGLLFYSNFKLYLYGYLGVTNDWTQIQNLKFLSSRCSNRSYCQIMTSSLAFDRDFHGGNVVQLWHNYAVVYLSIAPRRERYFIWNQLVWRIYISWVGVGFVYVLACFFDKILGNVRNDFFYIFKLPKYVDFSLFYETKTTTFFLHFIRVQTYH